MQRRATTPDEKSRDFMVNYLRDTTLIVDGLDFARNAASLHGKIALVDLLRMREYLFDTQGEMAYSVNGIADAGGYPALEIKLVGQLHLVCQRCLGSLTHLLSIRNTLLLAHNEAELARLDEDESVDVVLAEAQMDLLALLEDEMILSLPISPRHENNGCAASDAGQPLKPNPFAVLASLKKH